MRADQPQLWYQKRSTSRSLSRSPFSVLSTCNGSAAEWCKQVPLTPVHAHTACAYDRTTKAFAALSGWGSTTVSKRQCKHRRSSCSPLLRSVVDGVLRAWLNRQVRGRASESAERILALQRCSCDVPTSSVVVSRGSSQHRIATLDRERWSDLCVCPSRKHANYRCVQT